MTFPPFSLRSGGQIVRNVHLHPRRFTRVTFCNLALMRIFQDAHSYEYRNALYRSSILRGVLCAGDIAARIYQPGYSGYRGGRQKIYLVLEYELSSVADVLTVDEYNRG